MRRVALAAVMLAIGGLAHADPPKPDLASLKAFEGRWTCAGTFANGKPIASDLTAAWDAPSGSLVLHQDDRPPGGYHALLLWGGGEGAGFRAAISDGFSGVRWLTAPGWADDRLTWTRDQAGRPVERFIFTRPRDGAFTIEWDPVNKDGAFTLGDKLTCKAG